MNPQPEKQSRLKTTARCTPQSASADFASQPVDSSTGVGARRAICCRGMNPSAVCT